MNEEKKAEIKRNLESFEQILADLKKQDPEGDYAYLEETISELRELVNKMDQKHYLFFYFLRSLFFILILYLIYNLSCFIVIGFIYPDLHLASPARLWLIIPIASLVLLISNRIVDSFVSTMSFSHPLIMYFLFSFVVVLIVAVLDKYCFHICSSFMQAVLSLAAASIFATLGEICLVRNFIFKKS